MIIEIEDELKEPEEFDPEQCIYLLKPGFNPKSINHERDGIDMMYFNAKVAIKLTKDKFLDETFDQLGALFDWGDDDFFELNQCIKFRDYLIKKLDRKGLDYDLVKVYNQMLEFTNRAIELKSLLVFDFMIWF